MTGESFCDIGVDTSDLRVLCNCGCSHCCSSATKLSSSVDISLKKARPLKFKQQSRSCSFSVVEKPGVQRKNTDTKIDVSSNSRTDPGPGCTNIISSNRRKFSCALCQADFTRKHSLNIHLQRHACHNEKLLLRNTAKLYNHVIEEHETKQDQLLSSVAGHVLYAQSHSDNHKCIICQMDFTSYLDLCKHSAVHNNTRSFCCAVCSASFVKKDSLNIHLRKHSGERPCECDICGATFSRRYTLTNHRVLHSGEKNHVCVACGKSFPTRGALTAHEKISHASLPSSQVTRRRLKDFKPSICDQCGKVYSNAANLLIHKRTHTGCRPFLCSLCGVAFGKKYSLQCHMRRHSDDRPFKCGECGAAFLRKSTLNTHQRKHSGEKPYECKLCGRGFIQNSSLKYHIQHHDHSQASSSLDPQTTNDSFTSSV